MPLVPIVRSFVRNFFSPRRVDSDLDQEVRSHLEMLTEENIRAGMPPEEAQRAARIELGGMDQLKEQVREVRIGNRLHSVFCDCRYTVRRLSKSPGFTAVAVLTLALGIGANAAVFSVINSVLLKPLPYPAPNQLVALWLDAPGAGGLANFSSGLQLSPSMYLTFAEHNRTFQSIGLWLASTANVTGVEQPEWVQADEISDEVLETLAVPPMLGRWFSLADQDPRGTKTVMLSYGYWQRRLGRDRTVIGRAIQVDAQTRTIGGVMPRGLRLVRIHRSRRSKLHGSSHSPFAATVRELAVLLAKCSERCGRSTETYRWLRSRRCRDSTANPWRGPRSHSSCSPLLRPWRWRSV